MKPTRPTNPLDELLTAEQAATAMGVSVTTLWRRAAAGQLHPARVLGRTVFARDEVAELVRAQSTSPNDETQ